MTNWEIVADMCPKPNETRSGLSTQSHVEELEGIPGLFKALTDVADEEEKWSTFSFPVDFDAALYGAKLDRDFKNFLRTYLTKEQKQSDSKTVIENEIYSQIQPIRSLTQR